MEIIVKVVEVAEPQTFTSQSGSTLEKQDLILQQGFNLFIATAFDKTVTELRANPPIVGGVYVADLSFAVSGNDKKFQNVRLGRIAPMF